MKLAAEALKAAEAQKLLVAEKAVKEAAEVRDFFAFLLRDWMGRQEMGVNLRMVEKFMRIRGPWPQGFKLDQVVISIADAFQGFEDRFMWGCMSVHNFFVELKGGTRLVADLKYFIIRTKGEKVVKIFCCC